MNAETPSSLGRYRLVGVIGKGAMGVVYEATDPRLDRTVAIKTVLEAHLLDGDTSTEYLARFNREAHAAGRLNHPNIVTLFDFGKQDGMTYMVMEFVRGRELAKAFAQGEQFTLAEAVRIMGELLDALAYAHAQGVVHRDIKPANVMLDELGRVKLTDFGVARVTDTHLDRTMPGTMVGTPSYMSPEQIQGMAVGSRTDIFAAGVVLYQFLTGQRPFAGGGAFAIQRKIVQEDPILPSVANPKLNKKFDAIVMRALAKSPAARFENAEAFATALRSAVEAESPARAAAMLPAHGAAAATPMPTLPAAAQTPSAARRAVLPGVLLALALAAAAATAWWALSSKTVPAVVPPAPPAQPAPPAPAAPEPTLLLMAPLVAAAAPATSIPQPLRVPVLAPDLLPIPVVVHSRLVAPAPAPLPAPAPAPAPAPKPIPKPKPPLVRDPVPKPAAPRGESRRCSDLLQRLQLGEPLQAEDQAFFQRSCR